MRGLRSGLALHALAVHAERDQPPTRPTHTPIVRRARALIAPVQDISRFIRIWRRASRSDRFRRWPTTVAAPCAEVPLPLSGQGFSISQEYSGLLQGIVARRQDRTSFWHGKPRGHPAFVGFPFIRTRRHFAIKKSESASRSWSRE